MQHTTPNLTVDRQVSDQKSVHAAQDAAQNNVRLNRQALYSDKAREALYKKAFACAFPDEETGEGSAFWPKLPELKWPESNWSFLNIINPVFYGWKALSGVNEAIQLGVKFLKFPFEYGFHKLQIKSQIEIQEENRKGKNPWGWKIIEACSYGLHKFFRAILSPDKSAKIALNTHQKQALFTGTEGAKLKQLSDDFSLIRVDEAYLRNTGCQYKSRWELLKGSTGKGKALAALSLLTAGSVYGATGYGAAYGLGYVGVAGANSALQGSVAVKGVTVSGAVIVSTGSVAVPATLSTLNKLRNGCSGLWSKIKRCCSGSEDLDRSVSRMASPAPALRISTTDGQADLATPSHAWLSPNHQFQIPEPGSSADMLRTFSYEQRGEKREAYVKAVLAGIPATNKQTVVSQPAQAPRFERSNSSFDGPPGVVNRMKECDAKCAQTSAQPKSGGFFGSISRCLGSLLVKRGTPIIPVEKLQYANTDNIVAAAAALPSSASSEGRIAIRQANMMRS